MYIIDKANNRIKSIEQKTFSELGFKERAHLQEWIAYNPQSLGEDLLIIQKEFDGFDDTRGASGPGFLGECYFTLLRK